MNCDMNYIAEFVKNKILESWDLPDDNKHITKEQIKNLMVESDYKDFDLRVIQDIAKKAQKILIGSVMSKMASEGTLECAWDEDKNSMVFWKEQDGKNK